MEPPLDINNIFSMSKAPAVSANYKLYKMPVSDTATSFITFPELNIALLLACMSLNNSTYFFSRSINFAKTMVARTRNKLHL